MKLISVVTPCYNEEKNIEELYLRVKETMQPLGYSYEHIFIDNSSADNTVGILKRIAQENKNVKIIVNAKNFGPIRSPYYGMLQAKGDAVVMIFADLQDTPRTIIEFVKKWEEGYKLVLGVKIRSMESFFMYKMRSLYYWLYKFLSENDVIEHCTGFGLYDRKIVEIFRNLDEPYPYLKSLISEVGFDKAIVEYTQQKRASGTSSISLYKLYDAAISGITSDSRVMIRIATIFGFAASAVSLLIAITYVILKIAMWDKYPLGIASVAIGIFFFASIQLFFIGLIGEYIGAVLTQVKKRPLVIEKERINF
ncbi:MAG: dolichol monophosphate mannose synthase [Planctomycetes bacterium GWF2_41_51]|nr:MAG: dolichol monophosphate mannose synthase [Planctomycetes bacterium GWF2_41_51]